jgi:hypothetical protein
LNVGVVLVVVVLVVVVQQAPFGWVGRVVAAALTHNAYLKPLILLLPLQ